MFLSAFSPNSRSSNSRCFVPPCHASHTRGAPSSPPTSPAPIAALSTASKARSPLSNPPASDTPSVNRQLVCYQSLRFLWSSFLLLPNLSHPALNDHLHKIIYTLLKCCNQYLPT